MDVSATLAVLLILTYLSGDVVSHVVKDSNSELSPLDEIKQLSEVAASAEKLIRNKRGMKEDIEKGFKEFSDKVAKLPDQLSGSLKKFFEERGISMEAIQQILNDIYAAVEKLIQEVKKAM